MNTQLPEGITPEMLQALWITTDYNLDCTYCVEAIRAGMTTFPSHTPSNRSHRVHCTCDGCW